MNALVSSAAIAAALPVMAAEQDPVFAAMDRYRAAYDAYGATIDAAAVLEEKLPKEKTTWSATVSEPNPPENCNDAPKWIEAEKALRDAGDEHCRALVALVSTEPTTYRGALTLLTFLLERETRGDDVLNDGVFTGEYDAESGEPIYCDTTITVMKTYAAALTRLGNERAGH